MKKNESNGTDPIVSSNEAWSRKPVWSILLTIAGFFVALYVGTTPAVMVWGADTDSLISRLVAGAGVTIAAIGVVYLLRSHGRQAWSALRLQWRWTIALDVLVGVMLALLVIVASNIVSVTVGAAEWRSWISVQPDIALNVLASSFIVILLVQAFPEELLFRGHLFTTLSEKLSPWSVLLLTSVAFGSIHILSQSPAEGVGERILYVVSSTGLGFMLAAGRIAKGTLWLPVGLHLGHNLFQQIFVTVDDGPYSVQLIVSTVLMVLAGFIFLYWRSRRDLSKRGSYN